MAAFLKLAIKQKGVLLSLEGQDEFFTSHDEVHDSFDARGLQENLLRGIYAYVRLQGIFFNVSSLCRRERSQWSGSPNATEPRPPSMSLAGTGGFSTVRRIQNVTTKAADQRLAKVMASQNSHNEEDHGFKFAPTYSTINTSSNLPEPSFARRNQSQLPALSRNPTVQATSTSPFRMPPQASLKPPSKDRVQRYFTAVPLVDSRDKVYQQEASAIRDELDMLQEENENVLEQLHRAEEKRKEAEARVRELENQVASLGEDVSLEAKLLSRKEAVLRQREAALKAAFEKKDEKKEEVLALCSELQILKDEAATAVKRIQEAESDVKALRTMAQRMVLTQDEMEEVALKRCWLARYWGLAVQHGIFADIAPSRHDKWSALAPLPFELVLSAAQKAKELSRDVGVIRPKRLDS